MPCPLRIGLLPVPDVAICFAVPTCKTAVASHSQGHGTALLKSRGPVHLGGVRVLFFGAWLLLLRLSSQSPDSGGDKTPRRITAYSQTERVIEAFRPRAWLAAPSEGGFAQPGLCNSGVLEFRGWCGCFDAGGNAISLDRWGLLASQWRMSRLLLLWNEILACGGASKKTTAPPDTRI